MTARWLPMVRSADWIRATVAGAVIAWTAGVLPATVDLAGLPLVASLAAGVVLGSVMLLSMGVLQWRVLRPSVPRAAWWIATSAGAWAAGLLAFMAIATPLWHPGQPAMAVLLVGLIAGLAMALTVAAVSGLAVVRLAYGSADFPQVHRGLGPMPVAAIATRMVVHVVTDRQEESWPGPSSPVSIHSSRTQLRSSSPPQSHTSRVRR